jgi:hypothetical protein
VFAGCLEDHLLIWTSFWAQVAGRLVGIAFPSLSGIDSPSSTASVTTDFAFFFFDLIAQLEQFWQLCSALLKLHSINNVCYSFFNILDFDI